MKTAAGPTIAVALFFVVLLMAVCALYVYYRPTVEYYEIDPTGWWALTIVLPIAVSAAIAYLPALRDSARNAAAACVGVGLADFALSVAQSERLDRDAIALSWLFSFMPMLVLFAVTRLALLKRHPWTALVIGPLAYWTAAFAAAFMWILGTQPLE